MAAVMRLRLLLLLLLHVVIVGLMNEVGRRRQEGADIAETLVRRGSVICNGRCVECMLGYARGLTNWRTELGPFGQRIKAQLRAALPLPLGLSQPPQHSSYFARVAKLIELGLNWLSLMNPRCRPGRRAAGGGGGSAVEAAADSERTNGRGPRGRRGSSLSSVECEKEQER